MAVLLTGVTIALLWSVLDPIYFTNDDVSFRLAIAGQDIPGEAPSSHLLTIHAALATAAVALQDAWPGLPVWDLILSLTLTAGIAGLAASGWSALSETWATRIAAVVAIAATVAPFAFGLQFTISSTLCGGAATLIAIRELLQTSRPRVSMLAASCALLTAGFLVRPMGAEAGAVTTMILLGPLALAGPQRRARFRRLSGAAVVMAAAFLLLNSADGAFYTARGDWDKYSQYHWRNVDLIEWGGVATTGQQNAIRAAAGWTDNDWTALRRNWAIDQSRFGFDQMSLATAAAIRAGSRESLIGRITLRGPELWGKALATLVPDIALVALLALLLAGSLGNGRACALTAATVLLFVAICVGIHAGFKELPFRLLAPLKACFIGAVLVVVAEHRRAPSGPRVALAVLAGLAILGVEGRAAARQALVDEDHSRSISEQVKEVLALEPSLLVLHSDAFPEEHWWRPFRQPAARLRIIKLQRNNQSPRLQHFLAATGRAHLLASICRDSSILVIANPGNLEVPTTYLKEHDGVDVTWTQVFDGSFRVWRCSLSGGTPATSSS